MRLRHLLAAGLLASAQAAHAGIAADGLAGIGVTLPPGARLAPGSVWQDERDLPLTLEEAIGGRPTLLIFADFSCRTLCGPVLSAAAGALSRSALDPARDYRLLVLGLDAKDGAADAGRMRRQQIGDARAASAALFLHTGAARKDGARGPGPHLREARAGAVDAARPACPEVDRRA